MCGWMVRYFRGLYISENGYSSDEILLSELLKMRRLRSKAIQIWFDFSSSTALTSDLWTWFIAFCTCSLSLSLSSSESYF